MMKQELETMVNAKVEYEYERFLLDMQRTSKNNIIAKTEEICEKKKIVLSLKLYLKILDEWELTVLNAEENLLESIYRYATGSLLDMSGDAWCIKGSVGKILEMPTRRYS